MLRTLPVCALLALAACNSSPDTVPVDAVETSAAPQAEASAQDDRASPGEVPEVTLSADGIILVGAVEGRGTATTLNFGRDRAAVLDVLDVGFPEPALTRNAECGVGAMEFAAWGPLTLNFLGGKFVGWRAEQGAQVVTVDGIQLGNSLAEIKRERSAGRIAGTTLDGEFEYASGDGGTIGGFLEGTGDTARVTALHAGTNCFFR